LLTVSTVEALQQKFARSVFEMEFLEDPKPFAESLKNIPWLADPKITVESGRTQLCVRAVDIEFARKELPRLISDSKLTLTHYELLMPDLEEIFVNIIKGSST
jgi:hypothetical protein